MCIKAVLIRKSSPEWQKMLRDTIQDSGCAFGAFNRALFQTFKMFLLSKATIFTN